MRELDSFRRVVGLCCLLFGFFVIQALPVAGTTGESLRVIPDDFQIAPFPDSEEGHLAMYGRNLIVNTYKLIGPQSSHPITGNKLNCGSCHLNGGTKPYAAPYIGLSNVFPIFIGRENKIEALEERVNGCLERSLNGKVLSHDSHEMRAIVAYIQHLSKDYPGTNRTQGQGFVPLDVPDRAANPANGYRVYEAHCMTCHGQDGQGSSPTAGKAYPPLWGDGSYNDGAGMARLLTAARYIKANMPYGTVARSPELTDEEAYDVAAFINNQPRPVKANKEKDYPDLTRKPKDCPYPPYADSIPQSQHKYGPYNFTN